MNGALARGIGLAAVGTGAGIAVSRRIARRRDEGFYGSVPLEAAPMPGMPIRLPLYYNRVEGIASIHAASLDAVVAALPSSTLHPVTLPGGRAAVFVGAYLYREWTYTDMTGATRSLPPYGEVMVAALVTPRAMPPLLPLVLEAVGFGGLKGFVLHLPVTLQVARDGGRSVWGLPKFVADMDFEDEVISRTVRVSDEGQDILTLRVNSDGISRTDRTPLEIYSVREGMLLHTVVPSICLSKNGVGRGAGELSIGVDHPVAKDLQQFELDPGPVLTQFIQLQRTILPRGVDVGTARAYAGYSGSDRAFGRLTMRYPGMEPLDLYADAAADAAADRDLKETLADMPEPEPALV